jgi:hypothetical protein
MELDKRKMYLIAGVVALVVVMVIGFFYYNAIVSKNKPTVATNTGPSTSGTGTLGTLPPLQTTQPPTRPAPPVLHTDTSQPYATNSPRANEPVPTPTPVAYVAPPQQAPPTQAVDQSGMDSSMAFQYNDLTSLNETQLMQKYTPNYQNIDQDFEPPASGASGVAANGTDGVVTVAVTPPVTSIPSVALPAGVTLTVNQMNDQQSLTSYLVQLDKTLAPFDISNPANSTLISDAATDAVSNPTKYKADLAAGQNMLAQLQALPVPSNLAGLQESYYDLYTKYSTLAQDAAGISSGDASTQIAAGTAVQKDAAALGASLETTLDDVNAAQAVVENAPQ